MNTCQVAKYNYLSAHCVSYSSPFNSGIIWLISEVTYPITSSTQYVVPKDKDIYVLTHEDIRLHPVTTKDKEDPKLPEQTPQPANVAPQTPQTPKTSPEDFISIDNVGADIAEAKRLSRPLSQIDKDKMFPPVDVAATPKKQPWKASPLSKSGKNWLKTREPPKVQFDQDYVLPSLVIPSPREDADLSIKTH